MTILRNTFKDSPKNEFVNSFKKFQKYFQNSFQSQLF